MAAVATADDDGSPSSGGNNDAKRRIAGMCWKKGTDAMSKENWDYCIEMFGQCVTLVPDNLVYRQTLRNCEFRKYKNNKTGASMSGMRLMGTRGKVKKARNAKNWAEMAVAAEEGLTVNPWDAQLNADLGEAARMLGYDDVAIFGFQMAVAAEPKNVEYLKGFAEVLRSKGEYDRARECWKKIYEINPLDGHARSMMTQSDTEKLIDRSNMQEAKTTREVKQGYEDSVRGAGANQNEVITPGVSLEADLKRMIRKDPANKDNYQKLADVLRKEGRLEEALEQYTKAFEVGGDVVVREQGEEVRLEMLRKNLGFAIEATQKNPDDAQAREHVEGLKKELLAQEIEIFSRWIERRPQDLKLKFELGLRMFEDKKYQPAAQLFQQASGDTRIEGPALLMLAKCFLRLRQNSLALRQLEKAVGRFNLNDSKNQFTETHYLLARLYEDGKDLDKAEAHYTEVLTADFAYKDAHARLMKIQAERGGEKGMADLGDL